MLSFGFDHDGMFVFAILIGSHPSPTAVRFLVCAMALMGLSLGQGPSEKCIWKIFYRAFLEILKAKGPLKSKYAISLMFFSRFCSKFASR